MSPYHDKGNDNDLFQRYLEICNEALESNKDKFPYREIWEALKQREQDKNVKVRIIDDHPESDIMIKRQNQQLKAVPLKGEGKDETTEEWFVTKSYLEDVVKHPDSYIENPALINWDWISGKSTQE